MRHVRTLVRSLALVAAVAVSILPPGQNEPVAREPAATADLALQPKMRRLHLVRPDLLVFPLAFDVYA